MRRLLCAALLATCWPALVTAQDPAARPAERGELPRAVAREAVELYNADATRRSIGPTTVARDEVIDGDLAVLDGPLVVAGTIRGRTVAINADVTLQPGARLEGPLLVVGGALVGGRDATVDGAVRVFGARLSYTESGDLLLLPDSAGGGGVSEWLARVRARRAESGARVLLTTGKTYNRVEGLPIHLGPAFRGRYAWGEVDAAALGILRTADGIAWDGGNLGHLLQGELRLGVGRGLALGGETYDVVRPVEEWHLTDAENGLSSLFLHRDFRDHFEARGARVYTRLFAGADADFTMAYTDERWTAREARDAFSVLRNGTAWRPNPLVDEGTVRRGNVTLRVDSRNVVNRPRSGWYVVADLERGRGRLTDFAPLSPGVRGERDARLDYSRGFLDVRLYNRVAPDAQLNLRGVLGGWLGGDALPAQRRLSLGGPGTLPGFDFRGTASEPDPLTCASGEAPAGRPAQCDRVLLLQAEYRNDLHLESLLGDGWGATRWRPAAEWVLFADAGRGWLVDRTAGPDAPSTLVLDRSALPGLGTLRTDVGVGLRLGSLGLFVARSVTDPEHGFNLYVRLRERF